MWFTRRMPTVSHLTWCRFPTLRTRLVPCPARPQEPGLDDESGRGLCLVELLANWGYRRPMSSGKHLWCTPVTSSVFPEGRLDVVGGSLVDPSRTVAP